MSTLLDELQGTAAMPDITVSLPTLGRWYYEYDPETETVHQNTILKEGCNVEEIVIRVIGLLAELNYKDPYLLVTGQSMPKLLAHVCPEVLNPNQLSEVDIEAILLAARIASYGNEMRLEHKCSKKTKGGKECGEPNNINVDLQKFIMRYAPFEKEYFDEYELKLERLGQTVMLRPPPYQDIVTYQKGSIINENKLRGFGDVTAEALLTETTTAEEYAKIMESNGEIAADSIASCVLYVVGRDGEKHWDRKEIKSYIRGIPSDEVDQIRNRIKEVGKILGELSRLEYVCSKCKKENVLSLHMDPQRLFTRGEDTTQPKKPSPPSKSTGKTGKKPSRVMQR